MTVSNEVSVLDRLLTDGVLAAACPSRTVLDHVTSKWGVLLLVALSERTMRWGELRRIVEGISEKMLAQTLRTLEADGIVHREVTGSVPPRVDYSLTAARVGAGRPAAAAHGVDRGQRRRHRRPAGIAVAHRRAAGRGSRGPRTLPTPCPSRVVAGRAHGHTPPSRSNGSSLHVARPVPPDELRCATELEPC